MKSLVRWSGGILVAAGLVMLLYAGYTYVEASISESEAEALVPGQSTDPAKSAPTVAATLAPVTAAPTILPSISQTPSPARPQATATAEIDTAVGRGGLPRGKGADPARLIIPRLKLDTRVEEATWAIVQEDGTAMSEWQIPFDAVAHLSTTPKPGEAGNAVISGHHNLIGPDEFGLGKFAGLWNVKPGDPVYIFDNLGRIFLYRVAGHYVLQELGEPLSVREEHARQILQDTGSAIVTFETCWNGAQAPLSGNTYRWILVANLIGTVKPIQVPSVVN